MTGPSAIGSENGSPSSITSAPACSSAWISSTVRSSSGYPAVMYGTSARLPAARSSANRWAIASDEIVTDADAIALWILGLDDGAEEHAVCVPVGEVDQRARMEQVALRVADHANDRARQHVGERIGGVHDAQLEGIEHDQRADGVDAGEVDERLHDHRIGAAARIVAQLSHHLRRGERHGLIGAPRRGGIEAVGDR